MIKRTERTVEVYGQNGKEPLIILDVRKGTNDNVPFNTRPVKDCTHLDSCNISPPCKPLYSISKKRKSNSESQIWDFKFSSLMMVINFTILGLSLVLSLGLIVYWFYMTTILKLVSALLSLN